MGGRSAAPPEADPAPPLREGRWHRSRSRSGSCPSHVRSPPEDGMVGVGGDRNHARGRGGGQGEGSGACGGGRRGTARPAALGGGGGGGRFSRPSRTDPPLAASGTTTSGSSPGPPVGRGVRRGVRRRREAQAEVLGNLGRRGGGTQRDGVDDPGGLHPEAQAWIAPEEELRTGGGRREGGKGREARLG